MQPRRATPSLRLGLPDPMENLAIESVLVAIFNSQIAAGGNTSRVENCPNLVELFLRLTRCELQYGHVIDE